MVCVPRFFCCVVALALLLPAALAYVDPGPPVKGVGPGLFDGPVENGGFTMPRIETAMIFPPARLGKEMRGPVHGIREYTRNGNGSLVLASVAEYDRQGRLVRQIFYKNGVVAQRRLISFSPRGNRTVVEYTRESTYRSGYDGLGRPINTCYRTEKTGSIYMTTTQYDRCNRVVRSDSSIGKHDSSPRWYVYNPSGQLARIEQTTDGYRAIEEYQYDSAHQVNHYRLWQRDTLSKEITWTRDAQETLITVRRNLFADQWGPALERFHYNPAGKLLTRESYSWVCQNTAEATNSAAKHQGDPPLLVRTEYSYDTAGRLTKTAYFDGSGKPIEYNHYAFNSKCADCIFAQPDPNGYTRVEYSYDKDGPHWTAYNLAGEVAQIPRGYIPPENLPAAIRDQTYGSPQGSRTYTLTINWGGGITRPPRVKYDRHGDWIWKKEGQVVTRRKISYYSSISYQSRPPSRCPQACSYMLMPGTLGRKRASVCLSG